MDRIGRDDSFDFAFDFTNKLFFSETVAVCPNSIKGVFIGIKTNTGKGWAREVIRTSNNDLTEASLKFIDTDFVDDGLFFVDFGELREIIGGSAINN